MSDSPSIRQDSPKVPVFYDWFNGELSAFIPVSALLSDEVVEAAGDESMRLHHFRPHDHITRTILQAAIDRIGGAK